MVECLVANENVVGSNPIVSTILLKIKSQFEDMCLAFRGSWKEDEGRKSLFNRGIEFLASRGLDKTKIL